GVWFFTQPSIVDENGELLPPGERPLRFSNGLRIGGETNFKMNSDHWWFTLRVSVGALQFSGDSSSEDLDERADGVAADELGTIFGLEGQMGIRYVISTDRIRPYVQVAISYMRLQSFASNDACTDGILCTGEISNQDAFLPTNNIGAVHFQPGLELILQRDVALHLFVDVQRWVRFSAEDNWAPVFGVGVNFFT
ncbi:MAG: hypothetical protein AAFX94_24805, partial [Myxococcota bacterium]